MNDEQFEQLMTLLKEINENVKLITAKETGKDKWGLSDISSDLSSLETAIGSLNR